MASITLKGNPISTVGELPAVGSKAPDFNLVNTDLAAVTLADFAGKNLILNIFPSIDTPTCAASVKRFNEEASKIGDTVVLCVSRDLPFAHKRFCGAEGIENVQSVSDFRGPSFGADYGLTIKDGPIADLFSRAIIVIDGSGDVTYTQQVGEIADEPDYAAALAAVS